MEKKIVARVERLQVRDDKVPQCYRVAVEQQKVTQFQLAVRYSARLA